MYSAASKNPVFFFVSFHEDDELDGAYMHGYYDDNEPPKIYASILSEISKFYRIYPKNRIHNFMAHKGMVLNPAPDGSFEDKKHGGGVKYSVCVEIPDRIPMSKRIAANIAVIKK